MSRIKIEPDNKKTATPRHVPKAKELSSEIDRFRNTGKPPLPLDRSYNRQGNK